MSAPSVSGEPFSGGSERASKAFSKNRTCNEQDCSARLSMYNPGSYCSLHEPMSVPRTRGRKIAS